MTNQALQPTLHDVYLLIASPTQAIADDDGVIESGATGVYHGDVRAIRRWRYRSTAEISWLWTAVTDSRTLRQRAIVRAVGERGPDPELVLTRELTVEPGRVIDTLVVENVGPQHIHLDITLDVQTDFAGMDDVKAGRSLHDIAPTESRTGDHTLLDWQHGRVHVCARVTNQLRGDGIVIPPHDLVELQTVLELAEQVPVLFQPPDRPAEHLPGLRVTAEDSTIQRVVDASVADLRSLLLRDGADGADVFVAAGAPWFFTLFGRDALWAARMLLPLGPGPAMGTLRALARRQATDHDQTSGAAPGKVPHEVRAEALDLGGGVVIPPLYYGTIDATPLWICVLHDAWQIGAAEEEVAALLPHIEAGLGWIVNSIGGDGFIRYIDASGAGLANQGWKDSADGIRHRDGTLGEAPIALCEVQAYAHEAAWKGAALLRHFNVGDPDRWEQLAHDLAERFRGAFWVDSPIGPHPAVALDRDDRPVSSLTSNAGHLLGTGILDREEARLIGNLMVSAEMNSGFGLRTMARSTTGFNPLGYHTGSVWTHDTMIVARGLLAEGMTRYAHDLVAGLVRAAPFFDDKMPELFGGYEAPERPTPYASSCRPQGWSAAAMIEAVRVLLGTEVTERGSAVRQVGAVSSLLAGHTLENWWLPGGPHTVKVGDGTWQASRRS